MDGTLIDSEPVFREVAKQAAAQLGERFTDKLYLSLIGLPNIEVELGIRKAFGEHFAFDEFRASFESHWRAHVSENGIAPKPGATDLLNELRDHGVPYAIATSTPHDRARRSLQLAGLDDRFDYVIGGDQVENGKPAPDIFVKAADALATMPTSCIAIEDSKVGVRSAAAAQMHTIMVPDLKPPDTRTRELASEVVSSLEHARPRIMQLLGH